MLFVTPKGNSYLAKLRGNAVWQEYQKAADAAGVTGRTFYDCRRTFATVADAAKDPVAVTALMGHAPRSGDMQAVYRQMVPDDRLKAVVKVVHDWLFATGGDGTGGRKDKQVDDHNQVDDQVDQQAGPLATTRVQRAICRCLAAIAAADEPDKSVLRSVWNESEIALALSGDSGTVQKFLEAWDDKGGEKNSKRFLV